MSVINPSLDLRRFFRHGRAIALLGVLIAGATLTTAGFIIWQARQSALDEHRRSMDSMGIVLAEQTSRHIQVIDLILQDVQARIAKLNITTPAEFEHRLAAREFHLDLAERIKNVPQADAIVLVDVNGLVVNGSRAWPTIRIDLSDRDYYQHFKDTNDPDLFVGELSRGRGTGELTLFFARRINGPGNVFCGVVVSLMDIKSLGAFYQAAGQHLNQAVTLLRRDGAMLMRFPNPGTAIGVKLPSGSPWYERVAEGGGGYRAVGTLDNAISWVSVHPLLDYPLVVDVVMRETDILDQWYMEACGIATVSLAVALMFAGLFWILARQFRRQTAQNARLEETSIHLREGQDMLRAYAEMSADWFWEQDADFRFTPASFTTFIMESDDPGKTRWELAGAAMSEERWAPHKADLAARRRFRDFRWERVDRDGIRHFFAVNGDPMYARNGDFVGYLGTGRDITAEVKACARLAQANTELEMGRKQFDAVLSNITQGVCFFDGAKRLLLWNRRYAEIYRLPSQATRVGCSLAELLSHREAAGTAPDMPLADYLDWVDQAAARTDPSDAVMALKNGRSVAIHYQPMPGGGWVSTDEDVTERQQAEANISFMARHDALTRLPNRTLFREFMDQAIAMGRRGTRFAVLCMDLDNFKQVNDTLGHPVGDALLVAVANRLKACVRELDTVARLGGDEFAIIQLGCYQPDDAEALAGRIIAAFREPFDIGDHKVLSGLSIGVTVSSTDDDSYETLTRDADIALYLAKTEGRGTARFFEPEMDARIHARRLLELDLQGAVERGEFELYYQPQINLVSNKIAGFEALVRWNHPVRGFVSPLDFISVAEETGSIVAIGEWVLRTACFEAET
jgi:diguanylate cyclase (GGDEF)-like protein/PAS domain S-box-containing protein